MGMNSKQRRAFKRKYPYILEFPRPKMVSAEEMENWYDLYDKMTFEALVWCEHTYGKDSCIFRGNFSAFSIRFKNKKQYNWFILKWIENNF